MNNYTPPFNLTNEILDYVSTIMKKIGQLENYKSLNKKPILRKNNRIRSIHSSLAIEANSLSLGEVTDIINGKVVLGDQKEIQEVKNAYKAYEKIKEYNPVSIEDLKEAHRIMTFLILDHAGEFRRGNEGVFDENDNCFFIAPKPDMVAPLIDELFNWMRQNIQTINPLIISSVFHYEFVFIHPFEDGNGRIARLWQNVILANYEDIFEYIPIESQIKSWQKEYYNIIQECNVKGDCTSFIEFMLKVINATLDQLIQNSTNQLFYSTPSMHKLLNVMETGIPMTAVELMEKLGLKSKKSFRENYLKPALEQELIAMTKPDRPTSKNQMYYKLY